MLSLEIIREPDRVIIKKPKLYLVLTRKEFEQYGTDLPQDVWVRACKRGKHYKRDLLAMERRGQPSKCQKSK